MAANEEKCECIKEKKPKSSNEFNPYGKCKLSSMLFDLNIRFLPIEKSMFSGLTKMPKNLCATDSETTCDKEKRQPTKVLLQKLMEYKEFRRQSDDKENSIPLKTFLGNNEDMKDLALMSKYIPPETSTIQTQTDYRDGEAQTDPFSPDFYIPSDSDPANNELLSIFMLSYGCGLPAGTAEVEIIARLKEKKLWDEKQKLLDSKCQLEMRMKNIEEAYAQEWAVRDEEIERILNLRLSVTMKMLKMREEQNDDIINKRLEILWKNKLEEMDKNLDLVKRINLRAIRKIIKKKCKEMDNRETRDVVKDYMDHGSQVFAPLTRLGVFHDKAASKMHVQSCYLSTFEGILQLEETLFANGKNTFDPNKCKYKESFEARKRMRREVELQKIHETLKRDRMNKEKGPMQLKFLQKIEKPAMRPPTPSLKFESPADKKEEAAVTILQKTLRGRLDQTQMLDGKKMSSELIKELRSTHALLKNEQDVITAKKECTLAGQRDKKFFEDKEMKIDSLLSGLEGEVLSDAVDFLTKELDRLKEEKKVNAFVMLAERNRRVREAEESGMRQIEERRRRGADEVFKQIVKVHQDSVDDYLEDIITETVEEGASEEAKKLVKKLAKQVDDGAYGTELSRSTVDTEEIVARLALNFLIPEVNKRTNKEKEEREERKYISTVHDALFN